MKKSLLVSAIACVAALLVSGLSYPLLQSFLKVSETRMAFIALNAVFQAIFVLTVFSKIQGSPLWIRIVVGIAGGWGSGLLALFLGRVLIVVTAGFHGEGGVRFALETISWRVWDNFVISTWVGAMLLGWISLPVVFGACARRREVPATQ